MSPLKLRAIGNSVGVVLPKELLARLGVAEGDRLHVVEQPGNGLLLTTLDPARDEQVRLGRELMKEYRETFRALAK